jgi:hypothetical protein
MSFRDTEVILNKAVKEKIEGLKEQQGNPEKNHQQQFRQR